MYGGWRNICMRTCRWVAGTPWRTDLLLAEVTPSRDSPSCSTRRLWNRFTFSDSADGACVGWPMVWPTVWLMVCDAPRGPVSPRGSPTDRLDTDLAFLQWQGWLCRRKEGKGENTRATMGNTEAGVDAKTHRTAAVTHPHVALDVEGRRPREPERLHVGEDLRLEGALLAPRAAEPGDELVVHGAPVGRKRVGSDRVQTVQTAKGHETRTTQRPAGLASGHGCSGLPRTHRPFASQRV